MADLYLSIPDVEGTSTDENHEGEIVLNSWSWNIDRVVSAGAGSRRPRSNIEANEIVVEKALDKASPKLAESALIGKIYQEIELTGRVVIPNGQPEVFLKIRLSKVSVQSVQQAGDLDDQRESVVFEFSEIDYSFTQPGEDQDIEFSHTF